MRRQTTWLLAAFCAVTFSMAAPAPAVADNRQPPPHAEANGKHKAKKAKKSKKNGKENKPDYERAWDHRFDGLDRNRNRVVSREEWNGDDRSFVNHDWNRDGVLSGDELIAGATRPSAVPRSSTTPRPSAPRPSRPDSDPDEALFARRDTNRDGRVSRSEFPGTTREFDRLDTNRDGVLSPYEYGVGR